MSHRTFRDLMLNAGLTSNADALDAQTPVAQYVRMSTDRQRYSIESQCAAIWAYASMHDMRIVATYEDRGRSGLTLRGRPGLRRLLSDVERPVVPFEAVLVFDVSRWGRFQDPDEAAVCELACKRRGVRVIYCAEQFANDGSLVSTVLRSLKRSMAGEYSRELSAKSLAGACGSARKGYRQGGRAGFGLRRLLLDEKGNVRGVLDHGQRKYLASDRVALVAGPANEVATVQQIYRWFIDDGLYETEIATRLNQQGILSRPGRAWNWASVRGVLTNEKYVGTNVYNRVTTRLKTPMQRNPADQWIRVKGAFPAIVSEDQFEMARQTRLAHASRFNETEMLDELVNLLTKHGRLTSTLVEGSPTAPTRMTYAKHFGSLSNAYRLAGYFSQKDLSFSGINRRLRRHHERELNRIASDIELAGGSAVLDQQSGMLRVNGETMVALIVAAFRPRRGHRAWAMQRDYFPKADITIIERMDERNEGAFDYYVLPAIDGQACNRPKREDNGRWTDAYRFTSLDLLYSLLAQAPAGATEPASRRDVIVVHAVDLSLSREARGAGPVASSSNALAPMTDAMLIDRYARSCEGHRVHQDRALEAAALLQLSRRTLQNLLCDPQFAEALSADPSLQVPELLTCWGRYVERVG